MTGAALGAGDEVVDLVDEGTEERLVLGLEGVRKRGERDIGRLSDRKSRLTNQFLALLANARESGDLLVHIDIDVQKSRWILMDDASLLAIEEVEETSILLEFVLQCGDDLFEFLLDVHSIKWIEVSSKAGLEGGRRCRWGHHSRIRKWNLRGSSCRFLSYRLPAYLGSS